MFVVLSPNLSRSIREESLHTMMDARDFFNQRAASYTRLSSWAAREDLLAVSLRMIEAVRGNTVVDLGAGTGILLERVARFAEKIAVDNSALMLEQIRTPDITKILADITRVPLPSASAALAICRQVLHYADPLKVHEEVRRILVPNGYFHIVQITGQDDVPQSWYSYWMALRGVPGRRLILHDELLKYLADAHFKIVDEQERIIRVSYPWRDFFEKNNVPPERFDEVRDFFESTSDEIAARISLTTASDRISYSRRFTFLLAQSVPSERSQHEAS